MDTSRTITTVSINDKVKCKFTTDTNDYGEFLAIKVPEQGEFIKREDEDTLYKIEKVIYTVGKQLSPLDSSLLHVELICKKYQDLLIN